MRILPILACCFALSVVAEDNFGTLVFSDDFERKETQKVKDEPGNGWNTSSSWSAKGNKEVDLVDGTMYIYIHPEAIHAVDVGHAFQFIDGTATMRFKFHEAKDTLMLNFAATWRDICASFTTSNVPPPAPRGAVTFPPLASMAFLVAVQRPGSERTGRVMTRAVIGASGFDERSRSRFHFQTM